MVVTLQPELMEIRLNGPQVVPWFRAPFLKRFSFRVLWGKPPDKKDKSSLNLEFSSAEADRIVRPQAVVYSILHKISVVDVYANLYISLALAL
jgi:hypothetical protein